MKLLVDVSLSPDWVTVLAQAGMQAVHWATLGAVDAPDRVIAEYAVRNGYAVLTHDLDFSAMLFASGALWPSVVQIRSNDVHSGAIGPAVVAALREFGEDLTAGVVVTVDPRRTRVRILPFTPRT